MFIGVTVTWKITKGIVKDADHVQTACNGCAEAEHDLSGHN